MAIAEKSKMVNGRVAEHVASRAGRVLAENNLTISSFIRNSLEYVAREGRVPESGLGRQEPNMSASRLRGVIQAIESRPLPGKADYPGLEGDALAERLRMERYGY